MRLGRRGWLTVGVAFAALGVLSTGLVLLRVGPVPHDSRLAAPDESVAMRRSAHTAPAQLATLQTASQPEAKTEATRCTPEPAIDIGGGLRRSFSGVLWGTPSLWSSASIGLPTRGSLLGAVELVASEGIERAGGYGWGTESVVRSLERAVREVRRCHPGSPRLYVGDIARERGGWLRPHRSHQSGLDADVGFYYLGAATWYQRATAQNLDVARTWTLLRALIEGGNVETIFVDGSIQRLLEAHIATLATSERPADGLFERSPRSAALIRHVWGHSTHFHVRFSDPEAVELGRRMSPPSGSPKKRPPR